MLKTLELTGAALDWAVATALGRGPKYNMESHGRTWWGWWLAGPGHKYEPMPSYSTDWAQGGPIIEREGIHPTVEYSSDVFGEPIARCGWRACAWNASTPGTSGFMVWGLGETLLIAAMRCYVSSKIGNKIKIPNNLCRT